MTEFRITFRREDGTERAVVVIARDRAEAIGRASSTATPGPTPERGRVTVEPRGALS